MTSTVPIHAATAVSTLPPIENVKAPESRVIPANAVTISPSTQKCWNKATRDRIRAFLLQHHLPIGLAVAVLFGFLVPWPGIQVGKSPWNTISICGIFFLTGLQLQTAEVKNAFGAYVAIAFGFVSILAISPAIAIPIALIPLEPREFAIGLALFMAMPTTVSSGVLMTGEAKGNVALAVLFSVCTNIIGIFTIPFFLAVFMDNGGTSQQLLDPMDLLWKLTLSILLPLFGGKALRYFDAVVNFAKTYKLQLKLLSSLLLISVPWVNMSQSASNLMDTSASAFFSLVGLSFVFHGALLLFNYSVSRWVLPMTLAQRKSVVINASQKTVNTAMSVLQFLPATVGDRGLMSLPCIINHFVQIIMDAYLVSAWKKYTEDDVGVGGTSVPTAAVTTTTTGGNTSDHANGTHITAEWGVLPRNTNHATYNTIHDASHHTDAHGAADTLHLSASKLPNPSQRALLLDHDEEGHGQAVQSHLTTNGTHSFEHATAVVLVKPDEALQPLSRNK